MPNSVQELQNYLKRELERDGIRSGVERFAKDGTSTAGKRHEEIFTREYLCPAIAKYFYLYFRKHLDLEDAEISNGLGTEGFEKCEGYGFTPAHKKKHLFRKADIINSQPPESWLGSSKVRLPAFQACPDFAIGRPLPISVLGETKYFRSGTPQSAVKQLYDVARQAVFYLGAFHDVYESALVVVADASPDHGFHKGLELVRPELRRRFGEESGIHLLMLRIH